MTAETLTEDATTVTPTEFYEPGVYDGMPEDVYHGDPIPARLGGSLSSTGARKLLPPSCPARFAWDRAHPPASKKTFDFGKAAHALVLGVGAELRSIDLPDWRSKKATEFKEQCQADGVVPLLAKELDTVKAMAAALHQHPVASVLFNSDRGKPEQSLFWQDSPEQPWRRARLDWMPNAEPGRRFIVADYKTSVTAFPAAFGKTAVDYGYAMQAAWYLDGIRALGIDDNPAFLFVVQEKTEPYLVSVIELDQEAMDVGRALNRRALDIYAQCVSDDHWPAYSDEVELVSLPAWFIRRNEEVAW